MISMAVIVEDVGVVMVVGEEGMRIVSFIHSFFYRSFSAPLAIGCRQ